MGGTANCVLYVLQVSLKRNFLKSVLLRSWALLKYVSHEILPIACMSVRALQTLAFDRFQPNLAGRCLSLIGRSILVFRCLRQHIRCLSGQNFRHMYFHMTCDTSLERGRPMLRNSNGVCLGWRWQSLSCPQVSTFVRLILVLQATYLWKTHANPDKWNMWGVTMAAGSSSRPPAGALQALTFLYVILNGLWHTIGKRYGSIVHLVDTIPMTTYYIILYLYHHTL